MGSDPGLADARKVLQWILAERLPRFSTSDVYRKFRVLLRNSDDLEGVLRVLERHHYITAIEGDFHGGSGTTQPDGW